MGSTFKNVVATTLHSIGLTLCIVRVVVILLLFGNAYRLRHFVDNFVLIFNDLVYLVTFLLVLAKPEFIAGNRSFWFGFAVALANDVLLSIVVLDFNIHPLYKIALPFQLCFNFVIMAGSFFKFSLFFPQSKSKDVQPVISPTPMQMYQAPVHPPVYITTPTMSPLPPNPYKS